MAACTDPTDPASMTADQRLDEIAQILAEGILRLRRRAALTVGESAVADSPDSSSNRLDESGETRLHGHRG